MSTRPRRRPARVRLAWHDPRFWLVTPAGQQSNDLPRRERAIQRRPLPLPRVRRGHVDDTLANAFTVADAEHSDVQDEAGCRFVGAAEDLGAGLRGRLGPQLTALLTNAPILASSPAVNSFSANATGHRAPSSRFALSLKPNVAYLVLNFCALWKKQTTLPSLAYAGIPYQSLGERAGALALMMAWSRLPMARS